MGDAIVPGMNHEVEFETWNHLDFLYAIDVVKYVNDNVVKDIKTCSEEDCRSSIGRG